MRFAPHVPRHDMADLVSFLIIWVTAKRPGAIRYPGIPSILDAILRAATLYFIFMFVCQTLLEFFLFLAPVGDVLHF